MRPKFTDMDRQPQGGYTRVQNQGPGYLKRKFDAIRKHQAVEREQVKRLRVVTEKRSNAK